MPLVQNVSTRIPDTNAVVDPPPSAIMMTPTASMSTVGTSATSIRMSWARRSWTFAGGNRTSHLCHFGDGLGRSFCVIAHALRHVAHFPHEADRRERAQHVEGHVDLPPEKALARRRLVMVVVV